MIATGLPVYSATTAQLAGAHPTAAAEVHHTGIRHGAAVAAEVHHADVHRAADAPTQEQLLASLGRLGFPRGLGLELLASAREFPVRFWVVDNSGSMNANDGTRLVSTGSGKLQPVKTSRWNELFDTIIGIGEVAAALGARTDFHLLNRSSQGQFFSLASDDASPVGRLGEPVSLPELTRRVKAMSPSGGTPLTEAVMQIVSLLETAADKLRANGQRACVVLATDGMPNDKASFLQALRVLQRLPVWLVVRLCTDDEQVTEYWNELDNALECDMEVLDDEFGEADEVKGVNGWLAYGPALHRAREFGLHNKLFDLLDETALVPSQVKQCCEAILGCGALPEPDADLPAFRAAVAESLSAVPPVFDPTTRTMRPWVDAKQLCKKKSGLFACFA